MSVSHRAKSSLAAASVALLGLIGSSAHAALPPLVAPACGAGDISGASFISCAGYYAGNLISNSPTDQASVDQILASLGLPGTGGTWIEKLTPLSGATSINFNMPLNGITYIGIHRGGGTTGENGTAFYKLDAGAGTNLDVITYNLTASSNAALYATAPVPEPETYGMLMAGLGLVGWMARRRQQQP
ncbi:MAG: PEP-CTERM sorting domain-containing protein [Accumulibacter sp.]|jgi:hypothetical protein|uniref:PEP-CTERM sorting domain-containing protein n=1 Tax=Accumulibacter sp. TaxID=2053492 RepID=UPI002FC36C21